MQRPVNKVLVVRLLKNMAQAVITQELQVIAFGLENQTSIAEIEGLAGNLKIVPRNFRHTKTLSDGFRDIFALSGLIRAETPEVVHVNALQDLLFVFIAVHFLSPRKEKPAVVAMAHNPLTWKNPRKARLAANFIRFFADGFVCLTTSHQHQLLGLGVPASKLVVIPNPYDVDLLKFHDSTNDGLSTKAGKSPRIVYVANICQRKAQDILIRAASLVLKKFPDVNFDLIGGVIPGEERYAESVYVLARELNIHERVHFMGVLSHQEVVTWLAGSDIFAFPTRSEMMPRAVIEAMLAGKPVVASAVDGLLDLIENRETGILVQSGNPEELAGAICELIENPSLANKLGLAGRRYILEFCSPERVGCLIREFYQMIISSN